MGGRPSLLSCSFIRLASRETCPRHFHAEPLGDVVQGLWDSEVATATWAVRREAQGSGRVGHLGSTRTPECHVGHVVGGGVAPPPRASSPSPQAPRDRVGAGARWDICSDGRRVLWPVPTHAYVDTLTPRACASGL